MPVTVLSAQSKVVADHVGNDARMARDVNLIAMADAVANATCTFAAELS